MKILTKNRRVRFDNVSQVRNQPWKHCLRTFVRRARVVGRSNGVDALSTTRGQLRSGVALRRMTGQADVRDSLGDFIYRHFNLLKIILLNALAIDIYEG
jgi:hypothetical protein